MWQAGSEGGREGRMGREEGRAGRYREVGLGSVRQGRREGWRERKVGKDRGGKNAVSE